MKRLQLLFIIIALSTGFLSCNGNPKKLAGKKRKSSTSKKFIKTAVQQGTGFFGSMEESLRISLRPLDIEDLLKKKIQVGVLYSKGEQAKNQLRLIELSEKTTDAPCDVDWLLDIWTGYKHNVMEIMWRCRKFRYKHSVYSMSASASKTIGNMITKSRLHPDRWLAIVKVPVIHEPRTVENSIKEFVEETIPLDYYTTRYPSFKVITEFTTSLPKDLSKLDSKVKSLREILTDRLEKFKQSAIRRSGGIVKKVLNPVPEKEVFTRELYAKWSMTVICSLGTNSDRIYWMSQFKNVWVKSISIPTQYRMMFIKKSTREGPTFSAKISSLELDPPLEL